MDRGDLVHSHYAYSSGVANGSLQYVTGRLPTIELRLDTSRKETCLEWVEMQAIELAASDTTMNDKEVVQPKIRELIVVRVGLVGAEVDGLRRRVRSGCIIMGQPEPVTVKVGLPLDKGATRRRASNRAN